MEAKVQSWLNKIVNLAEKAESEPHAAFAAFTHGISARWHYFVCAVDITSVTIKDKPFEQLEDQIHKELAHPSSNWNQLPQ